MSTLLTDVLYSFYASSFYARVRHWKGWTFAYLSFVLFVCWVPALAKFHREASRGWVRIEETILPQMPELRFDKGQVTTPENRPYVLTAGGEGKAFTAIIDTSGKITSLDGQTAQILLTQTKLFVRPKPQELRVYDLSKSAGGKAFVLNRDVLEGWGKTLKPWFFIGIDVTILVSSLLKRIAQAFLIALAGMILCSIVKVSLTLGELFSLAVVSMTPAMILSTGVALAWPTLRHMNWVWFGMTVGYFLFAVNAALGKPASEEEHHAV